MKVLVAMSGGVDSSVAAALLVEAGHQVVGVTLKQWEGPSGAMPTAGCCTVGDAEDARRVAAQLDIPYYVLDYVEQFRTTVVEPFADGYAGGETPNPCIECNRTVRFSALLDRTEALGCQLLATGHHARVERRGDRWALCTATDPAKDQSYVLHMLGQAELARIRFPVGRLTKPEVRAKAQALGLRTASKPDSQDLCFIGAEGYRGFLRSRRPELARPGPIVDETGATVGEHAGTIDFTVGQRRGIGVASTDGPRYVTGIDPDSATVRIGRRADLAVDGCVVASVGFVAGSPPGTGEIDVAVKVRYRARPVTAVLAPHDADWRVDFAEPQLGVAPGQAAVFYREDEVLGGGRIAATRRAARAS
jgi:tRNA-specific 2-thiouridylase